LLQGLISLFALCLLLVSTTEAAQIKDVRLWRSPDNTRVVLDLSAPVSHNLIVLENPRRIVIDIAQSSLAVDASQLDFSGSPIMRLRSGVNADKNLRVVLDLSEDVSPRSFLLKASEKSDDRLVIDLYDKEKKETVVKHVDDSGRRNIVIAIAAGHGGEDPGASGPNKLREKNVVLAIAKELEALINQRPGFESVQVRTGDYYVGLQNRRAIARKAQADLLVSIHADAFTDHRAYGSSVFALSRRGASSATANFLANDANNSDMAGGVSLSDKDDVLAGVLTDLSMSASLDVSMQIGSSVVKEMGKISRLHSSKVEQANFSVLRSPDIPSILVETGFISNPEEARKLNTKSYQRKMAKAIFDGLNNHFVSSPPPDTLLAWQKRNGKSETEYVIARGDTLSGIAVRHKVSVAKLLQHNNLAAANTIKVGQRIVIPSS
jgi:N-acetylmuramoyl-L-alanine amidase